MAGPVILTMKQAFSKSFFAELKTISFVLGMWSLTDLAG